MAAIDRMLQAKEYPSVRTLVERLGACRRTLLADVRFMRDSWFAPIGHCRHHGGYYYTQPGWRPPFFLLTEGELVSLFIAERVMQQYRGTPWEVELSQAFRKLSDQLDGEISLNLPDLAAAQSFRLSAPSPHDVENFRKLVAAIRSRHSVQITYWTASRNETTDRKIDPLHLANIDGDWFLLAWCHLRKGVRTFAPSRIRLLRPLDETFAPPPDFDPAKHLATSFRIIQEERGPVHEVRLRFTGFAARYVGERTWHPSQSQAVADDASLELTLRLTSLLEVRKWALSWGSECEALEPAELRQQIAEEARRMLAAHTGTAYSAACGIAGQPATPASPQINPRPITLPSKARRTRPKP